MESTIKKGKQSTHEMTVSHTTEEIMAEKEAVLAEAVKKAKVKGFREGKAPATVVEEQIDKNYLHSEVINRTLQTHYPKLVKEHKLSPVANPRVNVTKWVPFETLEYTALVAERPEVKVGNYTKAIKKRAEKVTESNSQEEILEAILEVTKADIADMLIEEEANRMLMRLSEQIGQVGLTVENYLETKQQTFEELQEEYMLAARKTLTAELAFAEVIKKEDIEVTDTEIDEALKANPDEKSRGELAKPENRWYIESVLGRQKLMAGLMEVAEKAAPESKERKSEKAKDQKDEPASK